MYPLKKAQEIITKYNTSDPFEISHRLGVHIIYCDLPDKIQGFFQNIYDEFIIYINQSLNEEYIDGVVGHELGHIILHSELNTLFLKENTYLNVNKYEREANMFSAYLNIDKFEYDTNLEHLSKALDVDCDCVLKILEQKKYYNKGEYEFL